MKFDELIESMVTEKFKKYEGFNIYMDIFNFISTIKDKYKVKISYDLLNNFEEDERSKIKDISLKIIKDIFNYESIEANKDENEIDLNEQIEGVKIEDEDDVENKPSDKQKEENNYLNLDVELNNKDNFDDIFNVYRKPLKRKKNLKLN